MYRELSSLDPDTDSTFCVIISVFPKVTFGACSTNRSGEKCIQSLGQQTGRDETTLKTRSRWRI